MRLRIFLILIVCLVSRLSVAGWTKVGQFKGQYYCGYFFNEKVGFIGGEEGNFKIRRTIDGGKTWALSAVPNGNGTITSIFMRDSMIGYASVMGGNNYSLLKTTDAGVSWQDFTNTDDGDATCVYATSKAIIKTKWTKGNGGISVNNGYSYTPVFFGESNGIDFLDDLHGVVTMGPAGRVFTYYTSDGGQTWRQGGEMREAWGVYADKNSNTYYALAEDDMFNRGNALWTSTNYGKSWNWKSYTIFSNSNNHFTGHIDGVGNIIYVQTQDGNPNGMYRTDDGGTTWRNVAGPSNDRDTRFFVTGCRGEIVYAFDRNGGIYKTIDGGDGTLVPSPYIAAVPSVGAGETVLIPITYDSLLTGTIVQEINGALQLNDNLIQPDSLVFKGTQLDSLTTFDTVYKTPTGWIFDAKLKANVTLRGSSTKPLLYVSAHTYLTDTIESEVALQTIDFTINSKPTALSTCTVQSAVFKLQLSCGDSTLIRALKGEKFVSLFAVRPNPNQGNIILSSSLPAQSTLSASLYNIDGVEAKAVSIEAPAGVSENSLSFEGVPPGEYILSVKTNQGTVRHIKVVIER